MEKSKKTKHFVFKYKTQTRYDVNEIIFPYTVDKHTFNNFSSQCILSRVSAVDSGNNNAQSDYRGGQLQYMRNEKGKKDPMHHAPYK